MSRSGLKRFLIVMCVAGCGDQHHGDADAGADPGSDSGRDAGSDGALDAGVDAAPDASTQIVCASASATGQTIDPSCYAGLTAETFALLANPCVIDSNAQVMTLSARGGEAVYLKAADNTVIANAQTAGAAACTVPATYTLAVVEDAANPGVERVVLDYLGGPFALGVAGTPGVTLALGAGSALVVRGSAGADQLQIGSTYSNSALDHSWIDVNSDGALDVRFDGVTALKVTTGPGTDTISADGTGALAALDASIAFSAYGGDDSDTLIGGAGPSLLSGGDGDDQFPQGTRVATSNIFGGDGVDTVDYSSRTSAVTATVCSTCVADPSGCAAANTTCRGNADTAFATCSSNAMTAQTTCSNNANTARSTCNSTAASNHSTCTSACTVGDTVCTDACDMQHSDDQQTCQSSYSSDVSTCTSNFNAATATCSNTQTSAYAACDATQTSCQASATVAACAVCIGDDGQASEGDTINDDVEIVLGGKASDRLSARWAAVACTLKGKDGDDVLTGSAFADLLDGGNGNDTLIGGAGSDTLIGGAGIDSVSYADHRNAVKVSLDPAYLWVAGQNGEPGELDTIATDIENLTGGDGNDFLRGSASANIVRGGLGNDTIEGGPGNDSLYGDAGTDLLYGSRGNDMLVGGAGTDALVGGDGDDFLDASDSPATADAVIDCDGDNDASSTAGTSPGTSDALVKDSSDTGAQHCEL